MRRSFEVVEDGHALGEHRSSQVEEALNLVVVTPLSQADDLRAWLRRSVPVPTTSIYSKSDGIVAWRSCLEEEGPERENVEVSCSHTGMGFHPDVLAVIADRLALPEGAWRPYAPTRVARAGPASDR